MFEAAFGVEFTVCLLVSGISLALVTSVLFAPLLSVLAIISSAEVNSLVLWIGSNVILLAITDSFVGDDWVCWSGSRVFCSAACVSGLLSELLVIIFVKPEGVGLACLLWESVNCEGLVTSGCSVCEFCVSEVILVVSVVVEVVCSAFISQSSPQNPENHKITFHAFSPICKIKSFQKVQICFL